MTDQQPNFGMLPTAPVIIAILIPALTLHGLWTGASWLTFQPVAQVPLGNLAVWASLMAVTGMNWWCLASSQINRVVAKVLMLFAVCWYPVGIIWAGNVQLNFKTHGDLWLPFSAVVMGLCLLVFLLNLLMTLYQASKKSSSQQ